MNAKLARALGSASLAILLLPAAAQDRSACRLVDCSAAGLRPQVLRQAVEEAAAAPSRRSDAGDRLRPLKAPGDAWSRNLAGRPGEEDYSCVLGFGIGGQLGKQGFLGTRVLGQTQTWRTPDGGAQH